MSESRSSGELFESFLPGNDRDFSDPFAKHELTICIEDAEAT